MMQRSGQPVLCRVVRHLSTASLAAFTYPDTALHALLSNLKLIPGMRPRPDGSSLLVSGQSKALVTATATQMQSIIPNLNVETYASDAPTLDTVCKCHAQLLTRSELIRFSPG